MKKSRKQKTEIEKALQEVKEHHYAGEYASLEEFRKDLYKDKE